MEAEVSRQFVEDLLTSFLSAALGLELNERIEQMERLPVSYRQKNRSPSKRERDLGCLDDRSGSRCSHRIL